MGYSNSTTEDIRVTVDSQYMPDYSNPDKHEWFFAYTIRIENVGQETVRLMSRHWIITDANGAVQEVQGEGVVGEQPELVPSACFEYTSFCPLPTNFGTMHGSYRMNRENGAPFEVTVAPFSLDMPHTIH